MDNREVGYRQDLRRGDVLPKRQMKKGGRLGLKEELAPRCGATDDLESMKR
jgi:hypothetical protein